MDYKNILYEYRKTKNIQQEDLSKAIGVSQAYISQIESGKRNPSRRLIEKLEDAGVIGKYSDSIDLSISDCIAKELLLVINRYKVRNVKDTEIRTGLIIAENKAGLK